MQYDIENESAARGALEKILRQRGMNVNIKECGIFIDESGVLAASPDGIIDQDTIVEIKCLSKYRNDPAGALNCSSYGIKMNQNTYELGENSIWYDQIQAQLHITNSNICCLICDIPQKSIVVLVRRDPKWSPNINKLIRYYWAVIFPKIISKC